MVATVDVAYCMRHKFVPLPQALPNGAVACCETCGALNNEGVPGCLADEVAGDFNNLFPSPCFIN